MYDHRHEPLTPTSDHYNDRIKEHKYLGKGGNISTGAPAGSRLNQAQPGQRKVRARMQKKRGR